MCFLTEGRSYPEPVFTHAAAASITINANFQVFQPIQRLVRGVDTSGRLE